MLFHSFEFAIFFPLVLAISHILRKYHNSRLIFLLLASYIFYMSWNPLLILLILLSTLVDFFVGKRIYATPDKKRKKRLVITSLVINLGLLAIFKYTDFVAQSVHDFVYLVGIDELFAMVGITLSIPTKFDLPLPVGISFYTFQTLSYTLDIYRGTLEPERKFHKFALFVSFFPQLVAGPIVRASQFLHQLKDQTLKNVLRYDWAILLIMIGLFKKAILADTLGVSLVDPLFNHPEGRDSLLALLGCYAFSFQIYCDFSAYSDIAIGVAALLGFHIPKNFDSPFVATSIREFWRRWHISLSTWLRDYLYISLGGSKTTKVKTYINLLITMLLGGLWHGASWTMVIWGAMHGVSLAVNRFFDERRGDAQTLKQKTRIGRLMGWFVTFHIVVIAFVVFKAKNFQNAVDVFAQVVKPPTYYSLYTQMEAATPGILAFIIAVFVHFLPQIYKQNLYKLWEKQPFWAQGLVITCVIMLIKYFATTDMPFIYFQF